MLRFLIISFVCVAFFGFKDSTTFGSMPSQDQQLLRKKALAVLEKKCNFCHIQKNKSVVFSEKNMDSRARSIHKQVFVKKKMPKDGIKLSEADRNNLISWLSFLGID